MSSARRQSLDAHAKSYGSSSRCRPHDQMKVASVKAVRDSPRGLVQHNGLFPHCQIPRKRPMIELQPRGDSIDATPVQYGATGRGEVLGVGGDGSSLPDNPGGRRSPHRNAAVAATGHRSETEAVPCQTLPNRLICIHILLLILFTKRLYVRFAVRMEKLLAALLPCRFVFRRCDVPIRSAFFDNCS
jgi:hypothetical protein